MPEVEIITGEVEAISPKPEKDHYGIMVNDTWFNGEPDVPSNIEEGTKVEFEFIPGDFIDLKNVKVVDEDQPNNPKAQEKEEKRAEPSKGEGSGSTTGISEVKANKYERGMCFKAAAHSVPRELRQQSEEEYIEEVAELTIANMKAFKRVKDR